MVVSLENFDIKNSCINQNCLKNIVFFESGVKSRYFH